MIASIFNHSESHPEPTDYALATTAVILDHPVSHPEPERALVKEKSWHFRDMAEVKILRQSELSNYALATIATSSIIAILKTPWFNNWPHVPTLDEAKAAFTVDCRAWENRKGPRRALPSLRLLKISVDPLLQ
jgi:hypothetical protein